MSALLLVCRSQSCSGADNILSTIWPLVDQCLTMIKSISSTLCSKVDEFWYQQSQQLQDSQDHINSYVTSLNNIGALLPTLVEVLVEVKEDCSLPVLHNLTLKESTCLDLQLLIRGHQPSEPLRALLHEAAHSASPGCHISSVWQITVTMVQVCSAGIQTFIQALILRERKRFLHPWPANKSDRMICNAY